MHLSELLGEACNDLIYKRSSINLISRRFKDELTFRRRKPYSLAAKCLLVTIGALALFHYTKTFNLLQDQLAHINDHLQPMQELQNEIFKAKNQVIETRDNIYRLEELIHSRASWINFFCRLAAASISGRGRVVG